MTVSVAISILGIFLGLFVIGFGAFRRWGALPLSLAATAIVALTSRLDLWQAFSETYIGGYTNTFATYFLIFLTTCLYSKLMTESGCAMSLGLKLRDIFGKERVMTACCVAAAILTYAGISAFVLSYVMVPIMWTLFKDADIPRKLTICPIMFGCSTFVLGCTPGCTEMTNLNPALALGTPLTAAPLMSVICMVFLIAAGLWYSNRQVRLAKARGEHFSFPDGVDPAKYDINAANVPPVWKALLPTVVLCVMIIGGAHFVSNTRLLVVGTMLVCNFICLALNFKTLSEAGLAEMITTGLETAIMVVASFAAVLSFAAVAQTSEGFQFMIAGMLGWKLPIYVKVVLYTMITSGLLGSSASGSRVAINSIADTIIASGVNLEAAHRLVSIASTTVDTLPYCAALFAQLRMLQLSHKESYRHIFMLTVVQTGIACLLALALAFLLY